MATTAIGVTAARELDELYRLHAAEVFRYAYAVLGNRADAEDITQTTFVNALRALERGEKPRKPTNWLITIAHNLIRQRFRQQQARPLEVELDRDFAAAEDTDDGPSIDDLVRALQRIPPTQREALVLRELEGRSYSEIGELLGVSQSALESLIFRARRSLAEELENLVNCDRAELSLSRDTDGRLSRKERRRLIAHLDECASCARVAARSVKYRRAFKGLALLPLPFSLTLFKGAPSAAAATGLPTIGAGAGATAGVAAGVGAAGVTTKIAIGLAAVAVAGGAGYEGVKAVQAPAKPVQPAAKIVAGYEGVKAVQAPARPVPPAAKVVAAPIPQATKPTVVAATTPSVANVTPAVTRKPSRTKPGQTATRERGRSASAPGRVKTRAPRSAKIGSPTSHSPVAGTKAKASRGIGPTVVRSRGKSAASPGHLDRSKSAKPMPVSKAEKPQKQDNVEKSEPTSAETAHAGRKG